MVHRLRSGVRTLALVLALAGTTVAASADENVSYIFGAGAVTSCGAWSQQNNDRTAASQWVLGFVSGSNWHSGSAQANPADANAILSFVDLYCRNNPLHSIALAAAAAVQEAGGPKAMH